MDQDGQTGPPGRMVSQNGGPGWVRMGRQDSRGGWLARTEGQGQTGQPDRMVSQDGGPRWARMGRQESRERWLARTVGQDGKTGGPERMAPCNSGLE